MVNSALQPSAQFNIGKGWLLEETLKRYVLSVLCRYYGANITSGRVAALIST